MGGFTGLYIPKPPGIETQDVLQSFRIPPPPTFQLPEAPPVPPGIGWAGRGTQVASVVHSLLQGFLAGRAAAEQNMWQRELMINQMFQEQLQSLQTQYAQVLNQPPSPDREQKLDRLRAQMNAVWNARLDRWEALLDKIGPKGKGRGRAGAQPAAKGRGKAQGPLGTLGRIFAAPVQAVGRGVAAIGRLQVPAFIPDRTTIEILRQMGPPLPEADPMRQIQLQSAQLELQAQKMQLEAAQMDFARRQRVQQALDAYVKSPTRENLINVLAQMGDVRQLSQVLQSRRITVMPTVDERGFLRMVVFSYDPTQPDMAMKMNVVDTKIRTFDAAQAVSSARAMESVVQRMAATGADPGQIASILTGAQAPEAPPERFLSASTDKLKDALDSVAAIYLRQNGIPIPPGQSPWNVFKEKYPHAANLVASFDNGRYLALRRPWAAEPGHGWALDENVSNEERGVLTKFYSDLLDVYTGAMKEYYGIDRQQAFALVHWLPHSPMYFLRPRETPTGGYVIGGFRFYDGPYPGMVNVVVRGTLVDKRTGKSQPVVLYTPARNDREARTIYETLIGKREMQGDRGTFRIDELRILGP
jgi:hypothetical protein